MDYYVVKYTGPFGFIKPWTAVRDSETYSQQFLTPSIIEGIEKKLFPEMLAKSGVIEKIARHKLSYSSMDIQQEVTQAKGWIKKSKMMQRERSILKRGVMLAPKLYLAFYNQDDAQIASRQHICLCRNEDVLLPTRESADIVKQMDEEAFNELPGFELRFENTDESFLVGYNRFDNGSPMYGTLEMNGTSILKI